VMKVWTALRTHHELLHVTCCLCVPGSTCYNHFSATVTSDMMEVRRLFPHLQWWRTCHMYSFVLPARY
jgi:hypothetical protein